jgi:hypothetical protein
MSIYPHAKFRPVKFAGSLDLRNPKYRAVILHTNGGGTDHGSLLSWWNSQFDKTHKRLASHFQVMWDGTVEQYLDTDVIAWAESGASRWAISIETQDDSHNERPWTSGQLDAIVAICKWVGVPPVWLTEGGQDGLGWHEQFRSWNQSGHDCPGAVRENQIRTAVMPRLGIGSAHFPAWPGRILKLADPLMHGRDVQVWQAQMAHRGWQIGADGWYRPGSESACRKFQKEKGLDIDGRVGPDTWQATWLAPITQ